MDERYFKDKISAYLDNELSPDERLIVEEYIRTHPDTQEQLARLESLKRVSKANLSLGGDDLYWERNARKIESSIGVVSSERAVIPPKSAWQSHWGKITAVAGSVGILYFIAINKDDIEKKALPPESPTGEQRAETTYDYSPTIAEPPLEKPKRVEKDAQLQKSVEKTEEIRVDADQPINEKFEVAAPKVAQKEAIESNPPQMSNQMAPLSKATSVSKEIEKGVSPIAYADSVVEIRRDSMVHTLEDWIKIRDSLTPIIAALDARPKAQSPLMKALKAPLATSLRETRSEEATSPVLSWLDANFHIAEMTSDLVQKVSAIEALKSFQSHPDTTISAKAVEYLKQLTDQ